MEPLGNRHWQDMFCEQSCPCPRDPIAILRHGVQQLDPGFNRLSFPSRGRWSGSQEGDVDHNPLCVQAHQQVETSSSLGGGHGHPDVGPFFGLEPNCLDRLKRPVDSAGKKSLSPIRHVYFQQVVKVGLDVLRCGCIFSPSFGRQIILFPNMMLCNKTMKDSVDVERQTGQCVGNGAGETGTCCTARPLLRPEHAQPHDPHPVPSSQSNAQGSERVPVHTGHVFANPRRSIRALSLSHSEIITTTAAAA